MKYWWLMLFMHSCSLGMGQEMEGMTYFFNAKTDDQIAEFLHYATRVKDTNSATQAMYGAALAMSASLGYNPIKKLERFSQGKKILEQSLSTENANPVAHFYRLAVQINAPDFLNYNEHIKQDSVIVIESLKGNWLKDHPDLRAKVILFLQEQLDLSENQLAILNQ